MPLYLLVSGSHLGNWGQYFKTLTYPQNYWLHCYLAKCYVPQLEIVSVSIQFQFLQAYGYTILVNSPRELNQIGLFWQCDSCTTPWSCSLFNLNNWSDWESGVLRWSRRIIFTRAVSIWITPNITTPDPRGQNSFPNSDCVSCGVAWRLQYHPFSVLSNILFLYFTFFMVVL